ncbi:MAG: hypothetical protein SAJ12_24460, partial [Jaaginema sp. PMC 1079.18]|nr:hypothetical protein [Jaaginema sp. PMC 1079.18]
MTPKMPKKARKREPDELVLATFMIAYEKWQQFQKVARDEGTTASATLVAFIESYLTGARFDDEDDEAETPPPPENDRDFDERLEQALNEKLSGVDSLLNHLQN